MVMPRTGIMLAVVGAVVAAGIALSFYGSILITEDLIQETGFVGAGETLEVAARLDPLVSMDGVYVVQKMGEGRILADLMDPSGVLIESEYFESESIERFFEIESAGTFTLVVSSEGDRVEVVGVLGHMPESGLISVGVTGFYLVLAGLVGMALVGFQIWKIRRR